jgi:ABC-2 type transport system permease protein
LAVISSGQFTSLFSGKDSPLLASTPPAPAAADAANPTPAPTPTTVSSVIEKSAESARLIVFASNDFVNDQVLQLLGTAAQGNYQNSLQLMANTLDWSLEDNGLLSIRSRGNFNRTLPPLSESQQRLWEYLNYGLAAAALALIAFLQRQRKRAQQQRYAAYLAN